MVVKGTSPWALMSQQWIEEFITALRADAAAYGAEVGGMNM
jgi:hypothetical protein